MKARMVAAAVLVLVLDASAATTNVRAAHRYVITNYGAVPDGITINTKAIQSAIDKCALSKTGGVIVVPNGVFVSGAIFLKQGVDLLVEKDGVLKATTNIDIPSGLMVDTVTLDRPAPGPPPDSLYRYPTAPDSTHPYSYEIPDSAYPRPSSVYPSHHFQPN